MDEYNGYHQIIWRRGILPDYKERAVINAGVPAEAAKMAVYAAIKIRDTAGGPKIDDSICLDGIVLGKSPTPEDIQLENFFSAGLPRKMQRDDLVPQIMKVSKKLGIL